MKTRSFAGSMLLGIAGCVTLQPYEPLTINVLPPCYTQTIELQAARADHAASFTTDLDIPSEALARVRTAEQAYRACSGVAPSGYPHNTLSTEECAAAQRDIARQEPDYAAKCMISKQDWTLEERGRCIVQERSLNQLRKKFDGCE